VLASIALVQLDKVERHAEIRRRHVAIYDEGVADLDGVTPVARDARDVHANHLYVVRISFADRDEVQRALADENIGTSIHFLPVHTLSAYRDRVAPHQPALPVTERAGREVLSLPFSPAHSDDDVRDAVAALRRVHARLA
jgi:dTDP-4-amino-4,6-dideoxygalactose transaminase